MIEVCGKSVCGPARSNNEDSFGFRFVDGRVVMAVADGLGGCPYGEVASSIAVSSVLDHLMQVLPELEDWDDIDIVLKKAFNVANIAILRDSTFNPDHTGMCSTLTVAIIDEKSLIVAHYGDCRCYIVHEDELTQITEDHNLANRLIKEGRLTPEEALFHAGRSQIINCLGENKFIKPDIYKNLLLTHDCVILASDGMYSLFDEDACRDILQSRNDLERLCDLMMERGTSERSTDTSTVVIAKIAPEIKTEDCL